MKSIKKKKRILVDGLFNLDDEERLLPCDEDGVNFSQFCQLVEDNPLSSYVNFDEFDAVLSRRDWTYQFYEGKIPPRLLSFFHIQESPYTLHQGDFRPNNPILASYWRGSDIEAPYYKWIPSTNNPSTPEKNYAQDKYKFAAIVVSHCPTYNDRLRYVYQLQNYIPVDIYGRCGPLKCGQTCFENISRDYKFYLAFENANCRDYITEKLFLNALGNDIIPIVLGAHRDDYKYAAPPNSYIHVEDFPSVKELADYLTLLDQNDDLYNSYFKWKGTGHIVKGHHDLFCRVCAFLHYADFHPPPPLQDHWPKNPYNWLQVNPCLKPGEHFWE
ncbi:glycoprotein 3-alpha-L-fucosyltransferase A isoform X2 [Folsomia candida]|nr:glycoprotein 3-alpha-L-fucosyltransferase A isoform X2 [Folsomia candida]